MINTTNKLGTLRYLMQPDHQRPIGNTTIITPWPGAQCQGRPPGAQRCPLPRPRLSGRAGRGWNTEAGTGQSLCQMLRAVGLLGTPWGTAARPRCRPGGRWRRSRAC